MMKDALKTIRSIKLWIVGMTAAFVCAAALIFVWQWASHEHFLQSLEERSADFNAKMEERAAKQEADFQARMAEQRSMARRLLSEMGLGWEE